MTVRAWVPNSVTAWQDLRDMGVDAIMTNSTSAYVKWAATQCAVSPPAPPGAADQTGPSVTASLPGDTATVSDTVQVTGIASDDGGVESVSLLVDGVAVTSSAPGNDGTVAFDWNSAAVPNGTHTLQLQARDVAGNLGHSSVVSVTVQNIDVENPKPPTAVSGTWSTPNGVELTWSGASDNAMVTGYRVYRDDKPIAALGPSVLSHSDRDVANLTTYAYHVTALDAAGNESASSEPTDIQTGDDTAPTVPTVSAALSGTDGVEVSWSASTDNAGVAGYRVFRSGALTATVDTATSTLLDTGLGDGTAYTYRVVAFDASGNASAPSSPVTVTTPDRTAPSSPGGLSAVSGMQSVALSWTAARDNVGVTGYVVHRDGESLATLGGAARSYTDTGLDGTTAHRYQVTAIDAAGLEGPASNVVTRSLADKSAPTAPTGLNRTISGYTVRLAWRTSADNVGVTGYTVYRGGFAIGTTTTATAYTDVAAPPGNTHTYTVRATDAAGNLSAASSGISATLAADRTAPSRPTSLRATAGPTGLKRITLTWSAATDNAGVTKYYLFRGNSKYLLLGNVLGFTDTGLSPGVKYTYKVYALDASGNWSGQSGAVSATAR
jgi:fibronectin type 3 domain-containing protein